MQRLLEAELWQGERVVWSQQPRPAEMSRKSVGLFLVGVFLCSLALLFSMGNNAYRPGTRNYFSLFPDVLGTVVVLVAGAALLSPVWANWKARQTVYAITDQRALLIAAPWRRTIYSFVGQHLVDIHRVEDGRGRGDIVFQRQAVSGRRGDSYYDVGFFGIEGVREVENRLRVLYAKTTAS